MEKATQGGLGEGRPGVGGAQLDGYASHARKSNQDRMQLWHTRHGLLIAMADGHGQHGSSVSAFVQAQLPEPQAPLTSADLDGYVRGVHDALLRSEVDCMLSGCTLTLVWIGKPSQENNLLAAWVGDTRAVLLSVDHRWRLWRRGLRSSSLTDDHRVDVDTERERILGCGGVVAQYGDAGPQRVWMPNFKYPGLALSRTIGDTIAHSLGVCAIPQTRSVKLTDADRYVLVATDGLWEFVSPRRAAGIVHRSRNAEDAANQLVECARRMWQRVEHDARDDISVFIVDLPAVAAAVPHKDLPVALFEQHEQHQ
jgi:serine/threonine protein phosphatase PrpC